MNPLDKFEEWSQSDFLAKSESASERNGYLSYRAEWHSAAWGACAGILYLLTNDPLVLTGGVAWVFTRGVDAKVPGWLPYPKQFAKESLYLVAHTIGVIILGLAIQAIV